MSYIKIYGATALIFLLLDSIWLAWLAADFYAGQLNVMMAAQPNWLAALLFYPLFIGLLVYFAVWPNLRLSAKKVLTSGALFGLATYGTYELTNKAVLADWPWLIVGVDIAWGMLLSASSAFAGWYVGRSKAGH